MNFFKFLFVFAFAAVSQLSVKAQLPGNIAEANFFTAKYARDKVWDVQRNPAYPKAGQDWNLSGLKGPLGNDGKIIDWGKTGNRYLVFSLEVDNGNGLNSLPDDVNRNGAKYNVSLKLFESNGALVKVVSAWGKIIGLGTFGFMYEVEGKFGTFFSMMQVNATAKITYKPTLAAVTKLSEIVKGPEVANDNNGGASQTQIATGYYTLTARCSGKVLDVLDASKLDGAKIQQWKLNGNVAQHWKIEPVMGSPGFYILTSRCSGKVLDVLDASKLDGAKIQQWGLNGNIAQHWKIEPVRVATGYYILTARCSGKVLDVLDASILDGAIIQQWKLNGNNAQHWKLDMVKF
jgi:hypothetical protein